MINGIINIYKEKGYTSHDVVAKLRGITRQKKIGHTGTLDPDAEGVLPVCLGRATKVCDLLTEKDKIYETTLLFGITTDTQDISGTIIREESAAELTEERVRAAIFGYIGEYEQLPPMYSALKVNGKKLYELAREGKEVERKTRKVTIYGIRILEMNLPRVRMEVHCSKGTYIRTLCHDIGADLGCGGCMETLLRTRVSRFTLADSIRLSQAEACQKQGRFMELILPVDELFSDFRQVTVKNKWLAGAYNGNSLPPEGVAVAEVNAQNSGSPAVKANTAKSSCFRDGEQVRVYSPDRVFIGVYRYKEKEHLLTVEKMFLDREEIDRKRCNT